MSKDNYDDLTDFCGPKEFYDLDGDGHIDAFEAGMMLSDVEDELREHREYQKHYYSRGGSSSKEPQGCGCFLASGWFWLFAVAYLLFSAYCEHKYGG